MKLSLLYLIKTVYSECRSKSGNKNKGIIMTNMIMMVMIFQLAAMDLMSDAEQSIRNIQRIMVVKAVVGVEEEVVVKVVAVGIIDKIMRVLIILMQKNFLKKKNIKIYSISKHKKRYKEIYKLIK